MSGNTVRITNRAHAGANFVLDGSHKDSPKLSFTRVGQIADVDVHDIQFDSVWLETLAGYITSGKLSATMDGIALTADDARALEHTDTHEIEDTSLELREQAAAPATLTGKSSLYVLAADKKVYTKDSAGSITDLTSGGAIGSVMTERGDVIFRNATIPAALHHGNAGEFLTTGGNGADPSWTAPPAAVAGVSPGYMSAADKTKLDGIEASADITDATNVAAAGALMDPMTERGDMVYEGAAGPAALPHGNAGEFLTSGGHGADPSYTAPPAAVAGVSPGYMSGADKTKLDGIEASADITDATNVAAAGATMDTDFGNYGVLASGAAGAVAPVVLAASTFLARLAAGDIVAATVAQMQAILGITPEHYADFPGEQAVLADATIRTWIAPGPGNIVSAYARVATAHTGAGGLEHSHVQVLKNGVSIFNAATPILLDAAATTLAVAGVLSAVPGVIDFVAGDIFTIVEDYDLDGGGADTGAGLAAVVEYLLD